MFRTDSPSPVPPEILQHTTVPNPVLSVPPSPSITPPQIPMSPSPLRLTAGSPTPVMETVPITQVPQPQTGATEVFPGVHAEGTHPIDNVTTRLWMLTLFPSEDQTSNHLFHLIGQFLVENRCQLRAMVACRDVAPETGREHFHVGLSFMNLKTLKRIRDYFGPRHHYEVVRRNWHAVYRYVTNTDSGKVVILDYDRRRDITGVPLVYPGEFPDLPQRQNEATVNSTNNRSGPHKNEVFWQRIVDRPHPDTFYQLVKEPRFSSFAGQMKRVMEYVSRVWVPSIEPVQRVFYYISGPPGSGKSYLMYNLASMFTRRDSVSFSASGQPVGLEDFAHCIMFDDVNLSNKSIPHEMLFQLAGDRELRLDVKFGSAIYCPQCVLMTRCETINDLETSFGWSRNECVQLKRRCTREIYVRFDSSAGIRTYRDVDTDEILTYEQLCDEIRAKLDMPAPDPQPVTPALPRPQVISHDDDSDCA